MELSKLSVPPVPRVSDQALATYLKKNGIFLNELLLQIREKDTRIASLEAKYKALSTSSK
ncbi:MAG: hypothetical protein R3Y11_01770 [Pseudomonadota bacterium]